MPAVLESVERMTRVGIRKIITTPHIDASVTLDPGALEARLDEVSQAFQSAKEAIGSTFPEVAFHRGHEILVDVPEPDFSDARLRMAGTSFVLVEWPRLNLPPATGPVLEGIVNRGFRPIIAHPERYFGMAQSFHLAQQWRRIGAYLQVNYGSLVGRYGNEARQTAFRFLREGMVDYMASDFHGHATLKIYKTDAWQVFEALDVMEIVHTLSVGNPGRILADSEPLPVPPLPSERGFWARLKDRLGVEAI